MDCAFNVEVFYSDRGSCLFLRGPALAITTNQTGFQTSEHRT